VQGKQHLQGSVLLTVATSLLCLKQKQFAEIGKLMFSAMVHTDCAAPPMTCVTMTTVLAVRCVWERQTHTHTHTHTQQRQQTRPIILRVGNFSIQGLSLTETMNPGRHLICVSWLTLLVYCHAILSTHKNIFHQKFVYACKIAYNYIEENRKNRWKLQAAISYVMLDIIVYNLFRQTLFKTTPHNDFNNFHIP